jgi:hypothetical protein
MSKNCYSLLGHGSLELASEKEDNIFKLPDNIRLIQYTEFEKVMYLHDIVMSSITNNLSCDYNKYNDKSWKIYCGLNNGTILYNNIKPRVYEPNTDIKNMWISIKHSSESDTEIMTLGLYDGILKYEDKKHVNDVNDVYNYRDFFTANDMFNYEKRGISVNTLPKSDTNLKNIIEILGEYFKKKKPQEIITLHQFSCFEKTYTTSDQFSEIESNLEIEDFLTSKLQKMNIKDILDITKYLEKDKTMGLKYCSLDYKKLVDKIKNELLFSFFYINSELVDSDSKTKLLSGTEKLLEQCFTTNAPLKQFANGGTDKYILIVGKIEDTIITTALVKETKTPSKLYYIYNVCVHKNNRGMKISEMLFNYIAQNAEGEDTPIYLDASSKNIEGEGFDVYKRIQIYSKMGFSILNGSIIFIQYNKKIVPVFVNSKSYSGGKITYYVFKYDIGTKQIVGGIFSIDPTMIISNIKSDEDVKMESTPNILKNFKTINIKTSGIYKVEKKGRDNNNNLYKHKETNIPDDRNIVNKTHNATQKKRAKVINDVRNQKTINIKTSSIHKVEKKRRDNKHTNIPVDRNIVNKTHNATQKKRAKVINDFRNRKMKKSKMSISSSKMSSSGSKMSSSGSKMS